MTALTVRVLFDANVDAMSAQAHAWLTMAQALDSATDDLIRASRDLEHVWPLGTAAEAAHTKNAQLRAEASNAYQPCRRIGNALSEHADTVRHLQAMLQDIAVEAAKVGYDVDIGHGTVSAPQYMYEAAGPHANIVAQQCSSYTAELDGLVRQAADSDDRTRGILLANLPHAQRGFGFVSPPPVPETVLRAQRGRAPADVRAWWDSLTSEQQDQLIHRYPGVVGALDGVPATDRDAANRIILDGELKELKPLKDRQESLQHRIDYILRMADQGRLAEVYPGAMPPRAMQMELGTIRDQLAVIGPALAPYRIEERLENPDKPPAFLLGHSSAGDGRAIISVGNPDRADNVVTYVPGMRADLPGIGTYIDRADTMAQDAYGVDPSRTTASIVWLGYDAPDGVADAASPSYAERGFGDLRNFQSGLRATHDGPPSHNTVIGHSYGSTTVGFAAHERPWFVFDRSSFAANDLIFVGSPGVGADSASDLHIQGGHNNVWASTGAHDPIHISDGIVPDILTNPYSMPFGTDPDSREFGGRQFTSGDGPWNLGEAHSAYWDLGNPARDNIALIVTGQTNKVH
jgi:hypothetical protein